MASHTEVTAREELAQDLSIPSHRLPPFHDIPSEAETQRGFDMHASESNDFPSMDVFGIYSDPLYASLDILPTQNTLLRGDYFCSYGTGYNMIKFCFNNDQPSSLLCDNNNKDTTTTTADLTDGDMNSHGDGHGDDKKKIESCSRESTEMSEQGKHVVPEEGQNVTKMLTKEEISKCFYMSITQAAKKLNVGLTHFKKTCRELGILRWPHRKLMSIKALIKNIKELENKEEDAKEKLRGAVMALELEKKLMEEAPNSQLMENTRRLRQACFKANYYKRRKNTVDTRH